MSLFLRGIKIYITSKIERIRVNFHCKLCDSMWPIYEPLPCCCFLLLCCDIWMEPAVACVASRIVVLEASTKSSHYDYDYDGMSNAPCKLTT